VPEHILGCDLAHAARKFILPTSPDAASMDLEAATAYPLLTVVRKNTVWVGEQGFFDHAPRRKYA